MSIFDKVDEQKKRTEGQLSRGGGSRTSVRWWKPADGVNKIRVMPQWKDGLGGQFWREVAQHWNVEEGQKGPILCPKETPDLEGDCPICELVDVLRGDRSNLEAQRLMKDIKAKKTYLLNVVDLATPEYTVQDVANYTQDRPDDDVPFEVGDPKICVYACPVTVFDLILGLINTSRNDITDLQTGREINIKKIPNKDRMKTRYEVTPEFAPSDSGLVDPTFPVLDQVGFQVDYNGMVESLSNGRAADIASTMFSFNGSSHELTTGNPEVVSPDDLGEQMRQKLSA